MNNIVLNLSLLSYMCDKELNTIINKFHHYIQNFNLNIVELITRFITLNKKLINAI